MYAIRSYYEKVPLSASSGTSTIVMVLPVRTVGAPLLRRYPAWVICPARAAPAAVAAASPERRLPSAIEAWGFSSPVSACTAPASLTSQGQASEPPVLAAPSPVASALFVITSYSIHYTKLYEGELIDQFGNKQAGELIRSEDWNGLIAGIEGLLENVNAQISGLNDQVTTLNGRLDSIEPAAQALSEQHRISLSAGSARFAIGQIATLTAEVTGFSGEALPDLGNAANRPSYNFV